MNQKHKGHISSEILGGGEQNALQTWPNPKSGGGPGPCQVSLVLMLGSTSRMALCGLQPGRARGSQGGVGGPEFLWPAETCDGCTWLGSWIPRTPVVRQSGRQKRMATRKESEEETSNYMRRNTMKATHNHLNTWQ